MKKNAIAIGIILNFTSIAVANLSSLVLVPIFRKELGDESYGIYLLAASIITFFAVTDYHIGTKFVNEITRLNTAGYRNELGGYISQMLFAYIIFAAAIMLFCAGVAEIYPLLFRGSLSEAGVDMFRALLRLMSVNCFLLFFQNYLFCVITGLGFLPFTRICNIVRIFLRTVALTALLAGGHGPLSVVMADIFFTVLVVIAFILYAIHAKAPFSFGSAGPGGIKKNLLPMLLLYVIPMLDNFYWASCVQMVGRSISPEAAVEFNFAFVFCQVFTQLSMMMSIIRMGEVAELNSLEDPGKLREYITDKGIMQSVFLGFILVSFAAFGELFLRLWAGGEIAGSVYGITLVMMLALLFPNAHSLLEVELYAKGGYHMRTIVMAVMAAVNLVVVAAALRFGLAGVAGAVALTMLLIGFVFMNMIYHRAGIPAWSFTISVLGRLVPILTLSIGAALLTGTLTASGGVARWGAALIPISLFLTLAYGFCLNSDQRKKIKEFALAWRR